MLFYDPRDDNYHEKRGSQILYWLDDLGAKPLDEANTQDEGFVFAGARSIEDYEELMDPYPKVRDQPDERAPLLRLDSILSRMTENGIDVPMPQTWTLHLDTDVPKEITYPVFVRTASTSWKLGGHVSRANNQTELVEEAEALRRAIQWDAVILVRSAVPNSSDRTSGPL
ncbi:MAG: hypothetical protein ACFCD0_12175 [Gemmataceae bacterium]